jgi:hypothetical protein
LVLPISFESRRLRSISGWCAKPPPLNQTFRDRRHIATRAVTLNVAAPALDDRAWLNHRRTVVTRNAINANSEALELRDLSSEELDAVSGGFLGRLLGSKTRGQGGQNDPAQMFQQIMQQLTQR